MSGHVRIIPPSAWHLVPEDRIAHSTDPDAPCPCGAVKASFDPRTGATIETVFLHRQRFTRAEHRGEAESG